MIRNLDPDILADLQARIDKIAGGSAKKRPHLPFGIGEIDDRLPGGGLAYGCTHEIAGGGNDAVAGAASALFAAGIAARTTGPVIWCLSRPDLFAPALQQAGLNLERVIFVECDKEEAILESAEEALRYGGLGAVIAETVRLPMVAPRRLQLAAEHSGTLGLIIRRWRRQSEATDYGQPTASITRWRVSWMVELMRSRAGEAFDLVVGACDSAGRMATVRDEQERWSAVRTA